MKTKSRKSGILYSELTKAELLKTNGGGFAYDLGFFIRENVINLINGGGLSGLSATITDTALNYKPR